MEIIIKDLPYIYRNKVLLTVFLGIMLVSPTTFSQIFEKPNFSFSSHPTLEIESIELKEDRTMVNMAITNQRIGSSFCVDRNTYIRNSLGEDEYTLTESMGIPDCPDSHSFKALGEQLRFILVFPPIPGDLKYIDIVEDCPDACFTFKYVMLDAELNREINKGLLLYEYGKLQEALTHFEDLLATRNDFMSPVFGTIYLYLMAINHDLGEKKEVKRLLEELESSSILNKEDIIEAARFEGIIQ